MNFNLHFPSAVTAILAVAVVVAVVAFQIYLRAKAK